MSTPLDDALSGGGARSAFTKDTPLGTTITGPIIDATVRQAIDFATKQPKVWDDGRPQQQVVIRIQTPQRLDAEDDGVRGIYVKTWGTNKQALQDAVRATGATRASEALVPGAIFTATFTGTQPSTAGSDEKLYQYQITPAAQAGLNNAVQAQPQQPLQYQPPAAPPQQPQYTPPPAAPPQQGTTPPVTPEQVATARSLIAAGLDDGTIAASSGLPVTTVAALRAATTPA